ncbi:hypothetical protein H2199_004371 [Coniosporium tulheliwenetii]|uniref:Uncharacterized protein n=1 Tax=Coniosporium tulheliwenetii TaxID=3383036 RepID=A0ACC2Z560_9PEZI|nr:hypothetical protein H2199_004371 [Cladosporium sp. JES 115]
MLQCIYTVLIVGMQVIANTNSNLIPPEHGLDFDPEDIKERIHGSKMVLVVEQCMCVTIWTIKACLLIMYSRLTTTRKQVLTLKIVAAYVAFSFVFMEVFYLGVWCRPFSEYWAVPPGNVQCSAATNHLITNAFFNISSDLMIIAIPLPIFIQILSAVLNKFYSFTQPFGSLWTFWYIREASTAMLTANIPFTWTLLQRAFKLRSFAGSGHHRSRSRTTYHQFNGTIASRFGRHSTAGDLNRAESQENINKSEVPLEIWQNTRIEVSSTESPGVEEMPSMPVPGMEKAVLPGKRYPSG